jgi:hypothetical protein
VIHSSPITLCRCLRSSQGLKRGYACKISQASTIIARVSEHRPGRPKLNKLSSNHLSFSFEGLFLYYLILYIIFSRFRIILLN